MKNKTIRNSILMASIFGAISFSGQASAGDCKGLENAACSAESACSWVEGYERKDGRLVKSFCRAKPSVRNKLAVQKKGGDKKQVK